MEKIREYVSRIEKGESKEGLLKGLPDSWVIAIEEGLRKIEKTQTDTLKVLDIKKELGILDRPPIKYVDVVIDEEYMKSNLMPNGGLRMLGGQANWQGEVELMRYTISEDLSLEQKEFVVDKIKKLIELQEGTYYHESHHIKNRENNLTPHIAAKNLREFLTFRVLDEMSAFMAGEFCGKKIEEQNVLDILQITSKKIFDSYYSGPFKKEAEWYVSVHKNDKDILSREIRTEKYHEILRQYFKIQDTDVLAVLQKNNQMKNFTDITNSLIYALDPILQSMLEKK
jgi:hypothetical protein